MIVVLAQVPQDQCTDGGVQIAANEIGDDVVRQVPLATHDALFHRPRIRPYLQHFEIVIGLQYQQIRATQMELNRIRQIAEIGDQPDLDALRAKAKSHRIDGVMRDGKAVDLDVADGERGPGLKTIQLGCVLAPGNGRSREAGDINRCVQVPGERNQSADVIGVLVGDQNRVHGLARLVDSGEAREHRACEARVHQDAGSSSADEGRVYRNYCWQAHRF